MTVSEHELLVAIAGVLAVWHADGPDMNRLRKALAVIQQEDGRDARVPLAPGGAIQRLQEQILLGTADYRENVRRSIEFLEEHLPERNPAATVETR